ncbi:hypothetical protein GN316_18095 [Xylophilus sp. Kf1]|nr:hypothetical protein [Xylophilus sp. Kf1]
MMQDVLKGSIDAVWIGRDFVDIEGWVCKSDLRQAETPIVFTYRGQKFSGFGLNVRPDLSAAGIAAGMAGFNILLPNPDGVVPDPFVIEVADLSGARRSWTAAPEVVRPFTPAGAIDRVTSQTISGWIFNAGLAMTAHHAELYFEDEYLCGVVPHLERIELDFDRGDGMKSFGFEVSGDALRSGLTRHLARLRDGNGRLSLVAAGLVLSVAEVRWREGQIVLLNVKSFQPARLKVPCSGLLALQRARR